MAPLIASSNGGGIRCVRKYATQDCEIRAQHAIVVVLIAELGRQHVNAYHDCGDDQQIGEDNGYRAWNGKLPTGDPNRPANEFDQG